MEVLEALPVDLQAVVRPGATSPVRERFTAAAALRETDEWSHAAPRWRAVSLWLLCSATFGKGDDAPPEDVELPRGVRDGVTAILGRLDARGGGWSDPPDATEPDAEPLDVAAVDWSVEPDPRRWLVEGLIPGGRVSAIYGAGEAGKSRLLLQLALAVIRDTDGPVLPVDPLSTGPAAVAPFVRSHGAAVLLTWEDEVDENQPAVAPCDERGRGA